MLRPTSSTMNPARLKSSGKIANNRHRMSVLITRMSSLNPTAHFRQTRLLHRHLYP